MNSVVGRFLVIWFVCGIGLWIASEVLADGRITNQGDISVIIGAGLVLALIKPIVVLFSLPALLYSLVFFMIIINAVMILLASHFYSKLEVDNFGTALMAGIIIGLVNWLVTTILEEKE